MKGGERLEVRRGEVWLANLGHNEGCEQRGVRPVLIIQNDIGNMHSPTTIVASITDAKKRYMPTHVTIDPSGYLPKRSVVLLEQLRTIDKIKIIKFVTVLPDKAIEEVNKKLKISLNL